MAALYRMPALPSLELPAELCYEQIEAAPRPCLAVRAADRGLRQQRLRGRLSFDYGGTEVAPGESGYGIVQAGKSRVLRRDPAAEREAEQQLEQLGRRPAPPDYASTDDEPGLEIPANRLPQVARELVEAGWHVEAEGRPYRSLGAFEFPVRVPESRNARARVRF